MCVFCIVALICSSEAAFARRRVIDPRAQSRRGEAKKALPPGPPRAPVELVERLHRGRLRLQRIA